MPPIDLALAPEDSAHELAIAQRAAVMRALILDGAADPRLPDLRGEQAIFDWARAVMVYRADPDGWDTVRTLPSMLTELEAYARPIRGDCMHRATLAGAALVRAGLGCWLVFQAFSRDMLGAPRFSHVLVMSAGGVRIDPQECPRVGMTLRALDERVFGKEVMSCASC